VLKVSPHLGETRTEIAALALWNGNGAARLLAADAERGALLLERIQPGTMLEQVARTDDDASTRIAASLLATLWQSAPPENDLRSLDSWLAAYDRNRAVLSAGATGFPKLLFQRADSLRAELLASTTDHATLHGDLHHFNVLRSDRAGWLAIDPKGLVGDRYFDLCQFLVNPDRMPLEVNQRHLDILCEALSLDRRRAADWCLVHAVLDACWSFEEGAAFQRRVEYAEQTLHY
jgi:streptomycin 6-kinase